MRLTVQWPTLLVRSCLDSLLLALSFKRPLGKLADLSEKANLDTMSYKE